MQFILLFCLLTFSSCGQDKKKPVATTNDVHTLMQKKGIYKALAHARAKKWDGWVTDGCDSALFTGLYAAAGGEVELLDAQDPSGKFLRRPVSMGNCYPGESKSEISKDMYVGLFWGIWETGDLAAARSIAQYGEAHDWVMGEGDPSRTILSPALVTTLYLMIEALGGPKAPSDRDEFPIIISDVDGFQAHLLVLHMLIRSKIAGAALEDYVEAFAHHAKRQPNNALFKAALHHYTDGNQIEAINLLMDEGHWPADALPTEKNHCEFWLWQRDEGKDWEPCGKATHSGADWLFAAQVILGLTDSDR